MLCARRLPMKFLTIIIILTLFTPSDSVSSNQENPLLQQDKEFPFQRIIWSYWNTGISQQTPIIVQICLENLAIVAEKHNFKFILLSDSNVKDHIENYDEVFAKIRKQSVQTSFSHVADLIRVLVTEQKGGIWFDATTILLNGLDEIENIMSEQYRHMIANRFSPTPEVMLFYFSVGQNRIQQSLANPHNQSDTILYNELPSYELWSIFAKKGSQLMTDIRKVYSNFTVSNFLPLQHRLIEEDIYMTEIDEAREYLYIEMAADYVLQKKQLELDQGLGLFEQRQYAPDYYKFWALHSEYGPMVGLRDDLIPYEYLFWYSKEDLEDLGFTFRFFMKQFGAIREPSQKIFNSLISNFKNNTISFEQFISSNPSKQLCESMKFIVQGSIIANLLTNSSVLSKHGIPIITQTQHTEWQAFCSVNDTFWVQTQKQLQPYINTLTQYYNQFYKIHKAKVETILHQNQELTLGQWMRIKFNDNSFLMYEFLYMTVIGVILFGTYWEVRKIAKKTKKYLKFIGIQGEDTRMMSQQLNTLNNQQFSSGRNKQFAKNIKNTNPSSNHLKTQVDNKKLFLIIFSLFILSLCMWNAVDCIGGRQQPQTILLCVLVIFIGQSYVENKIEDQKRTDNNSSSLKYCYELFYMMINFMATYLCLVHMRRNRFWLYRFAEILGLVGPCVIKLQEILSHRRNDSSQDEEIKQGQLSTDFSNIMKIIAKRHPYRLITLVFLTLTIIFSNLRYMAGDSGYFIKYVPIIPVIFLIIQFISVTIKCFQKGLWFDIIRLCLLLVVQAYLLMTYYTYDSYVGIFRRISLESMTTIVMTTLYLTIGSEFSRKGQKIENSKFLHRKIVQLVFLIVPLFIQVILGIFVWYHDRMAFGFKLYWMHYLLFSINALIACFLEMIKHRSHDQQEFRPINSAIMTEELSEEDEDRNSS